MPTNSILTIHRQTVMVHPIVDRYYTKSPHHVRSSAFVQEKGLASNEKNAAAVLAASAILSDGAEGQKKMLSPTVPLGISLARTRTPDQLPVRPKPAPYYDTRSAVRSMPVPPAAKDAATVQPSQGNIKKKRKSLSELEQFEPAPDSGADDDDDATGLDRHGLGRPEFGNPNKIAQYFPELRVP